MNDPFELERFVVAQAPVYERVLSELRRGRKESHWMWFVFPQIAGLGHSELARKFAITSREEARAYLDHPILGPRLHECTGAAVESPARSVSDLFGSPDDLKFRSSMTLFDAMAPQAIFGQALEKFFGGRGDEPTLRWLEHARDP
ncbi:MAG TPA: DUF1810 domain-containing protein [Xanthobacteraceae bacterium]|nr:DUF1810 domain-containing protein [Xanthobacteraceae bacterium]